MNKENSSAKAGEFFCIFKFLVNLYSRTFMKHILILSFAFVLVTITSCKKEDPGEPGPNEVWLEYQLFRPSQIQVTPGTTVKFINKGNPNHQVQGALFSTGTLQTDDVYEYTFNDPGVYYFTCGIHGNVQAEQVAVRVQ